MKFINNIVTAIKKVGNHVDTEPTAPKRVWSTTVNYDIVKLEQEIWLKDKQMEVIGELFLEDGCDKQRLDAELTSLIMKIQELRKDLKIAKSLDSMPDVYSDMQHHYMIES